MNSELVRKKSFGLICRENCVGGKVGTIEKSEVCVVKSCIDSIKYFREHGLGPKSLGHNEIRNSELRENSRLC